MRIITTCFGKFRIENNLAISQYDDNYYYHLPIPNMTNDEIKDYFRLLKEELED